MRKLDHNEVVNISGGVQFFEVTSKINIAGVPQHCIDNYYNLNKEIMSQFIEEHLDSNIVNQCPELTKLGSFDYSTEWLPVSISLVNR